MSKPTDILQNTKYYSFQASFPVSHGALTLLHYHGFILHNSYVDILLRVMLFFGVYIFQLFRCTYQLKITLIHLGYNELNKSRPLLT